jgi:hypothetical protein
METHRNQYAKLKNPFYEREDSGMEATGSKERNTWLWIAGMEGSAAGRGKQTGSALVLDHPAEARKQETSVRVVLVREMPEADIKQVGDSGPTIDSIQVAEFESQAALKEWLSKNAPAFVR